MSRSVSPRRRSVGLDRGSDDGLFPGLPIVIGNGLLLGKIAHVTPGASVAVAVADPSFAAAVTLFNGSRTIGVAEGGPGDLMTLRFIPADEPIDVGNLVVTSGLEEGMPSGLVVGVVTSVRLTPGTPFQEAVIEPAADLRRATSVTALLPEEDV